MLHRYYYVSLPDKTSCWGRTMTSWRFSIVIFPRRHVFGAYKVIIAITITCERPDWLPHHLLSLVLKQAYLHIDDHRISITLESFLYNTIDYKYHNIF